MRMSFEGAPDITADVDTVWRALLDPNVVARAAPNIESVEATDPTHFNVVVSAGLGSVHIRFRMQAELFDIVEHERASLRVRGKAPGSVLDATTTFQLEEMGPRQVRLHWRADAEVGGTIAGTGARLLEGTARRLTEKFWDAFAALVTAEAAV